MTHQGDNIMHFGMKQHPHGRHLHLKTNTTGFVHEFESKDKLEAWITEAAEPYPRFRIRSTDLIKYPAGVRDVYTLMVKQLDENP